VLHVYNFRGLPHAVIWVGRNCLAGEFCLIRGQGGVHIGDAVLIAPRVQMLAVNHLFDDPSRAVMHQGITARGIIVEDGAWIGAGAILLDGVQVGGRGGGRAGRAAAHAGGGRASASGTAARRRPECGNERRRDPALSLPKGRNEISETVRGEAELLRAAGAD